MNADFTTLDTVPVMTASTHPTTVTDQQHETDLDTAQAPLPVLAQIALALFGLVCLIVGPVLGAAGAFFAIGYGVPIPVLIVGIGAGLVFFTLWGLTARSRR